MRQILRNTFLLLSVLVSGSCGGEFDGYENPSSPSPVTLPKGSMSARVNGVTWNADESVAARRGPGAFLSVDGGDHHAWSGSFYLNTPLIGTQTFVAGNGACSFSNTTGNFGGNAGSVTITTLDATRVAGTFDCGALERYDNGSGAKTMTVVNGVFDIQF